VNSAKVLDNSLTSTEIDESSTDIDESSLGKVADADTLDGRTRRRCCSTARLE
jgi:hypothetical protein